jgi:hypothetical protein
MKLNACILLLAHMVFYNLNTVQLINFIQTFRQLLYTCIQIDCSSLGSEDHHPSFVTSSSSSSSSGEPEAPLECLPPASGSWSHTP